MKTGSAIKLFSLPAMALLVLLSHLPYVDVFGESLDIKFTKFVGFHGRDYNIYFEGMAPPNFYGYWFMYDADNELMTYSRIIADGNGKFFGASVEDVKVLEEIKQGIGYFEVYRYEDVDPNLKHDSSSRLLRDKIDVQFYIPKKEVHTVSIKSGMFVPSSIQINLYDTVNFSTDCIGCYKLKFLSSPVQSIISEPVSLNGIKFDTEGKYKIVDIFNPRSELLVNVVYPGSEKVTTENKIILEEKSSPVPEKEKPVKDANSCQIEAKKLKSEILKLKREIMLLKKKMIPNNKLNG